MTTDPVPEFLIFWVLIFDEFLGFWVSEFQGAGSWFPNL
jgi:hypothetical protein